MTSQYRDHAHITPPWGLRYAPHLGYRASDAPLLRHQAASLSAADQAEFAARLGFAGVQYPWAASRPAIERLQLARELKARGLACGCVVWAPVQCLREPIWVRNDAAGRTAIRENLSKSMDAAEELGSEIIAVLGAANEGPMEPQLTAMAENLRWAGDMVAERNMRIGLEPMLVFPNMALRSCEDGLAMIERADHPAVQLIFDTGHVHDADPDVLGWLKRAFPHTCLVQFADQPGRTEPGAGKIDFQGIIGFLKSQEYRGLVELEHGWADETPQGERAGLQRLRDLDSQSIN